MTERTYVCDCGARFTSPLDAWDHADTHTTPHYIRCATDPMPPAVRDVAAWLPGLKPAGHEGDDETGEHFEDCEMCTYEAIEARLQSITPDDEQEAGQ